MTSAAIGALRLASQRVSGGRFTSPAEVVAHMGAMQAQDYGSALWAVGVRTERATEMDVEQAIVAREIVRTWPMRGTLHFVPPCDARWMVELMATRVIAGMGLRSRQLELDDAAYARSRDLFIAALEGGRRLSRSAMYEVLDAGGVPSTGQRGYHILSRLAQEGLLCIGPREGKQPTFVLLDEWAPHQRRPERDEALAELARRYFTSHGPATLKDFAWWTGLKITDARQGLQDAAPALARETIDGTEYWMAADFPTAKPMSADVHLLPGFDEFLLGYQDRSPVLEAGHANQVVPGNNGVFAATVVHAGLVRGTWKRTMKKGAMMITPAFFADVPAPPAEPLEAAAARYAAFRGTTGAIA